MHSLSEVTISGELYRKGFEHAHCHLCRHSMFFRDETTTLCTSLNFNIQSDLPPCVIDLLSTTTRLCLTSLVGWWHAQCRMGKDYQETRRILISHEHPHITTREMLTTIEASSSLPNSVLSTALTPTVILWVGHVRVNPTSALRTERGRQDTMIGLLLQSSSSANSDEEGSHIKEKKEKKGILWVGHVRINPTSALHPARGKRDTYDRSPPSSSSS